MMRLFLICVMVTLSGSLMANEDDKSASEALHALFNEERTVYYKENPGTGPIGQPRPAPTRWQSVTLKDQKRRQMSDEAFLARLEAIDRSALNKDDQVNYDMFAYMLETRLTFARHKSWRIPFFSDSGFHTYIQSAWQSQNFRSVKDYEAYIARLRDVPRYLHEHQNNLSMGIRDGWTMPRVVLDGLMGTFEAPIVDDPTESRFYGAFNNMADTIAEDEQKRLRSEAQMVIQEIVIPAYRKLYNYMKNIYYRAARKDLGATNLPNGEVYYGDMVRYYTTLDITPEEVHALGLKEVARIRAEMEEIIEQVGFEGSFKEFLTFLRTDPQFYAKTEKELLMHASYIAKKIDGRMPSLFKKLPRQPYGVEAVPAAIAPNYTTGRYYGAPLDAPRGGYYWVNTYALDKRPLYVLPALTLHEGVPGHHHQSALSKELENVPEFRLGLYPHAYGEGWGLYSEKLGLDLGVYETPYEQFGRLTYEMWRACRLVIDTGLHSKGWTRDQAIELLEENSALSTHNIRTEVDRYISWPGQALAYKMGELTFLRLREEAKEALGDKFDIRDFHDKALSLGGVPLNILEAHMDAWVKENLSDEE